MVITEDQRLGSDILLDYNDTDDIQISSRSDLKLVIGRNNLRQAIINRIRTQVGELSLHPNYGCRLPSLIGQNPTPYTLTLAKQYIREALLQEPRVESIVDIKVYYLDALKTTLQLEITVLPSTSAEPLNIVYPYFITGEV